MWPGAPGPVGRPGGFTLSSQGSLGPGHRSLQGLNPFRWALDSDRICGCHSVRMLRDALGPHGQIPSWFSPCSSSDLRASSSQLACMRWCHLGSKCRQHVPVSSKWKGLLAHQCTSQSMQWNLQLGVHYAQRCPATDKQRGPRKRQKHTGSHAPRLFYGVTPFLGEI